MEMLLLHFVYMLFAPFLLYVRLVSVFTSQMALLGFLLQFLSFTPPVHSFPKQASGECTPGVPWWPYYPSSILAQCCFTSVFSGTCLTIIFRFFVQQEKHHRDVHASFDDHLCQHCGKGFKLKKYLQIHIINSHTAKQDKPFPCHLCEKGFNNHMKLTQHLVGKSLIITPILQFYKL